MRFYNRKEEIEILDKIRKDFRIAVLGRRRIGKTRLVEHFYKKDCLTFFIPGEKAEKEIISNWVDEYPEEHLPRVNTFREFFEFVFVHYIDKVIFLDEIQNILKVNESFIFDLQRLIDKHKPRLVISGSLISTMKKIAENYKSPLYGRFDFILKLKELDLQTVYQMGKDLNLNIEAIFQLYSIFGGIPKYYELIEKLGRFEFDQFVIDMFIKYPRPLYEEVRTMLKEEFGKEHKTFFSILSSISQGKNKSSEIAGFIGRKQTDITKYLSMLKNDFEIIKREIPLIDGKKGVYGFRNNIFDFWFSYVWRYSDLVELNGEESVISIFRTGLSKHVSFMFEKIIIELLKGKIIHLPFEFERIGRQWGKIPNAPKDKNQYEIDICAINEKTKEILFGECKWKEGINAERVLAELKNKAKYVCWNNDKRREHYAIFAKSFEKRTKEAHCFDLNDLEKALQR